MAKTTNSVPQACAKVEIQTACTGSWTDIGGESMTVTLPKEALTTGSMPVFNSSTHVLSSGKKEPITATVSGVYTEDGAEAFEILKAVWVNTDCEKVMCLRVTPAGGTVGDKEIYVGEDDEENRALLVGFKPPDVSAGSGDPAAFEFDIFGNYTYDAKAS